MFHNGITCIGVDPTAGHKPFVYAALDENLSLLAVSSGNMETVLAFAAGQQNARLAINSPLHPNQGLMEQDSYRQSLSPIPRPGRWNNFRVAEYQLRQHNIHIPQTLAIEAECPGWMQCGFQLVKRLKTLGYQIYPDNKANLQMLEIYPHVCFTALLEKTPLPKTLLEGRLQRQLLLYEQKINVPDPMDFFEEITRHRLLKGILPFQLLYSPQELDAVIAAYTAWITIHQPKNVCAVGDPGEGIITLPVPELKYKY